MRNLTWMVFTKLGNSKEDGGENEFHIVSHYGFFESGVFCFVLLESE